MSDSRGNGCHSAHESTTNRQLRISAAKMRPDDWFERSPHNTQTASEDDSDFVDEDEEEDDFEPLISRKRVRVSVGKSAPKRLKNASGSPLPKKKAPVALKKYVKGKYKEARREMARVGERNELPSFIAEYGSDFGSWDAFDECFEKYTKDNYLKWRTRSSETSLHHNEE